VNRLLILLLAGCGQTDARLYVEQDGSLFPDAAPSDAAAPADTGQADIPEDTSDAATDGSTEPVTSDAEPDVAGPDVEPDATEFGPACAEIDEELEFGSRILGDDHEEIIRVRNCGGFEADNLVIDTVAIVNDDVISSDPAFELSGIPDLPFALLPNEAWPFPVRYSPTGPGEHTAVVRFTTNAPDAVQVDVQVSASVLE
jgi:hypothetical protein